jgi:hypothetical protein
MLSRVGKGTSLITFAFAIYNFHRIMTTNEWRSYPIGSHQFVLVMVAIGFVRTVTSHSRISPRLGFWELRSMADEGID